MHASVCISGDCMQRRNRSDPSSDCDACRRAASALRRGLGQAGFTLVELMIAVAIIAALTAIAIPSYQAYVERARRAQAMADISTIAVAIERHYTNHFSYPATLAALGAGLPVADPWGSRYQYLAIEVVPPPSTGDVRRDKNLNPLNSDYDLYSMGPDGQTQKQLSGLKARDDIVRAGNGGYIGVASEH